MQSQQANRPPQTANCPPRTGPRAVAAFRAPIRREFLGAFQDPLMMWNVPPPIAPMENAPPMSSTMRQGQGSLSAILSFLILLVVYSVYI